MKFDLIFHLVSKRKWKERQESGYYKSEDEDSAGGVVCYAPEQVAEEANSRFRGRKTILMLVINSQRVSGRITTREIGDKICPVIEGRLNLDAIIDKIRLEPNEEGFFEIDIAEK